MAAHTGFSYDDLMREVALRMETSKISRRSFRPSVSQSSKRHSARVEKSRSAHPSPRTPERRRTSTTYKQYASLDDHYRRMMGLEDEDEEELPKSLDPQPSMRPVSWHPTSALPHFSPANYVSEYMANVSPTSHYDPIQTNSTYQPVPVEPTWSQYMHGQVPAGSTPQPYPTVSHQPATWYTDTGSQLNGNASSSQNSTSWQAITYDERNSLEADDRSAREQSVELIGLGLYDEPGFTVKIGSKLEEECDPPEEMEDADEDGESSDDDEEELPKPEDTKPMQNALPLMNMAGQSFFFTEDESAANGWWPDQNQLKQPVPQVSSVNIGWI